MVVTEVPGFSVGDGVRVLLGDDGERAAGVVVGVERDQGYRPLRYLIDVQGLVLTVDPSHVSR